MREIDAHFDAYEHLQGFPREDEALHLLRRAASLVKPIMRKRGWKIGTLAEFYPDDPHLQGLNINKTQRIFLRLRSGHRRDAFLVLEVIVDTLLHELSHIVWGPHDHNFQRLWDELRDEHQALLLKGYTGEYFLSEGKVLGGKRVPLDELRRRAREAAVKRINRSKGSGHSGQRLGGSTGVRGNDMRQVIADAALRRNKMTNGCGAGSAEVQKQATEQSRTAGFRTKAEEDDANDLAISNALIELMEMEEEEKLHRLMAPGTEGVRDDRPLSRLVVGDNNRQGPRPSSSRQSSFQSTHFTPSNYSSPNVGTSTPIASWACEVCTLVNPSNFLCCDACGVERPVNISDQIHRQAAMPSASDYESLVRQAASSKPLGWNCDRCGSFMDTQWWTCSACGLMKAQS
ncbi:WLM-domain-containing protein [Pseudovirgaria hyperparasitica]|uniref:WLM-domain-containing protein n=1 Tax=Pseudovirgaria hyperparasitica TaxID=470096 RepID=A0A6A6VWL0_9PEZI|nr:WLM-domain-containing protein [Pseudovirgaria hyperparasitica]KAF2754094.1 WLM-domain-containing protein [Pseudovirgaria hyperparasitica]